jgi:hypothetical protein
MKPPFNPTPRAYSPKLEGNRTPGKHVFNAKEFTLRLPLRGWTERGRDANSAWWSNAARQTRVLEIISGNAGFPAPDARNLEVYRRAIRQQALEENQGIIEVRISQVNRRAALRTINKFPLEDAPGFGYSGWLCIPLRTATINLYTRALEGTEQLVSAFLRRGRNAETRDPYDPEFNEVALNSVTDSSRFDLLFPRHPLSLVRRDLRALERGTALIESVLLETVLTETASFKSALFETPHSHVPLERIAVSRKDEP